MLNACYNEYATGESLKCANFRFPMMSLHIFKYGLVILCFNLSVRLRRGMFIYEIFMRVLYICGNANARALKCRASNYFILLLVVHHIVIAQSIFIVKWIVNGFSALF